MQHAFKENLRSHRKVTLPHRNSRSGRPRAVALTGRGWHATGKVRLRTSGCSPGRTGTCFVVAKDVGPGMGDGTGGWARPSLLGLSIHIQVLLASQHAELRLVRGYVSRPPCLGRRESPGYSSVVQAAFFMMLSSLRRQPQHCVYGYGVCLLVRYLLLGQAGTSACVASRGGNVSSARTSEQCVP